MTIPLRSRTTTVHVEGQPVIVLDELIGAPAIAHEIACSTRTVTRLFAEGRLPGAYKLRGPSSPIRMPREAVEKLREGQG